jgi:hypothetical protein
VPLPSRPRLPEPRVPPKSRLSQTPGGRAGSDWGRAVGPDPTGGRSFPRDDPPGRSLAGSAGRLYPRPSSWIRVPPRRPKPSPRPARGRRPSRRPSRRPFRPPYPPPCLPPTFPRRRRFSPRPRRRFHRERPRLRHPQVDVRRRRRPPRAPPKPVAAEAGNGLRSASGRPSWSSRHAWWV